MSVVLHNLYGNTIDSNTTENMENFQDKRKIISSWLFYMYILWRIPNVIICNVLYIFTFCSILTKRSSEKYTTDIQFICYTNHTYLFGSILVYGSLLFLSSAHVMKQEISKGRNYFYFKYDKTDNSYQP